jgi:hypothetical protein
MTTPHRHSLTALTELVIALALLVVALSLTLWLSSCSSSQDNPADLFGPLSDAGKDTGAGTGGTVATGGAGGSTATGGVAGSSTGGAAGTTGSGGTATGGAAGAGGTTSAGGTGGTPPGPCDTCSCVSAGNIGKYECTNAGYQTLCTCTLACASKASCKADGADGLNSWWCCP